MSGTGYKIEYAPESRKNLVKFPQNIQKTIITAIEERLPFSPQNGKPLTKEWKGHRRLRVGDYRIIYKIIEDQIIVLIIEIDNRKNVYG